VSETLDYVEEYVELDDVPEVDDDLDETTAEFVDDLVKKLILFIEEFCDVKFFPYQLPIAYSFVESIVLGDGEEKTLIATRQMPPRIWTPSLSRYIRLWITGATTEAQQRK